MGSAASTNAKGEAETIADNLAPHADAAAEDEDVPEDALCWICHEKTEQRSGKIISRVSKSSNETVPVEALHDTRIGLALFSMQQIRYPKEEISQSK